MKRVFLFLAMMLVGVLAFAQETITVSANSEDISQSLDLKVVAKLFAEAESVEQFEIALNNPDSAYSNLDLNGDGNIDYLRVVETGSNNSRLIVIQAVLAKDIYQDVASIYTQKDEQNEVSVQIVGDEYVYGTNYIIEPVYIYRPVIYTYLWSSIWHPWYSPWYWGYYPHWWYSHHCYAYHWYYDRCYRFHHYHYYCSFRHGHHHHHGYHEMHSNISRRDYAVAHPTNSFNVRNTGYRNASELKRTGTSHRDGAVRYPSNNSTSTRTFNSRNTVIQRSGNTQRTTTSSTPVQRSTSQSGASRTQQTTRTSNSNRTTVSTQRGSNNGHVRTSTPATTHRSSTPTRSSSSNSSYRPSGSPSSSSRSGSYSGGSRSGGSISRGSSPAPSRSSGGHSIRK